MLKHVKIFLKRDKFATKALNIGLFRPDIRHAVSNNLIQFSYINFIS